MALIFFSESFLKYSFSLRLICNALIIYELGFNNSISSKEGALTFSTKSCSKALALSTIKAPASEYSKSLKNAFLPASDSIMSLYPYCVKTCTASGVIGTLFSFREDSFGTPMVMIPPFFITSSLSSCGTSSFSVKGVKTLLFMRYF